jgi:hypothetical protein
MGVLCQLKQQESNMDYRDEDPRNDVDYQDTFDSFLKTITGREDGDDLDFYEPRPILPVPTQEDLDHEKAEAAEHKKQVDYFVKAQIDLYCKDKEKRAEMYAMHGFEVE